MKLFVCVVLILLLKRISTESPLENVESSSLKPNVHASPTVSTSTTSEPEITVPFGPTYGISCIPGTCRLREGSHLNTDWNFAAMNKHFHEQMETIVNLPMPKKLAEDDLLAHEVIHFIGYDNNDASPEVVTKHYNRILGSVINMLIKEGTYYHSPADQIFLCLNKNYSAKIQECTTGINEAYEICKKDHGEIKENKGICTVAKTFKICESIMNVHIRKHCSVDPRPRFLDFVESLCTVTGEGMCGTYDSFYKHFNSCLPLSMRKEFQNIGGFTAKVYESSFKTGATFCNFFSSFLNGTFEDHCDNLLSRYRCMKHRYRKVPLCRLKVDPMLLQYEQMCGKPMDDFISEPPKADGTRILNSSLITTSMVILAKLLSI